MKPTICAAIIARNEERDIPRCIRSMKGVIDHFVLVDTGSTDKTEEAALHAGIEIGLDHGTLDNYLDASEPTDKLDEWRLTNFAKARNRALELAEASGCSHVLWIDADDTVITPMAIRRAAYMPKAAYGIWIELGNGIRQVHHRLYPAEFTLRFEGWVHEYLVLGKHPVAVLNDACIVHDATPHESAGEDSNQRNLRILTAQYAAEPNARTAFYLANTHKDGGRWKDATFWYRIRLGYGDAWRDEWLFALLYLIRAERNAEGEGSVVYDCERGIKAAPEWQEFRMELAFHHYRVKDYAKAIEHASKAINQPIPQTVLWREPMMYRDQPARIISWCHEHMGNLEQALIWSEQATKLIGQPDAEWAKREAVLRERAGRIPQAPAIVHGLRRKIALHRPGAIGDILMTLNLIPAFKEANPDTDVHYFCSAVLAAPDALGSIMTAAGVDMVIDCAQLPAWRGQYERVIDLVGYPLAEGYPEKPMQQHLLHYFAHELGLTLGMSQCAGLPQSYYDALPALTLRRPADRLLVQEGYPKRYITIQKKAGWSKYKEWSEDKWQAIERFIYEELKTDYCEISDRWGTPLAKSISFFANATMHIGIDSFCNHLTNYYWTDEHGGRRVPGVILWGSTQARAAGYPSNTNLSTGLSCQPCFRENPAISRMPRGPCINPPRPSYDDPTPHACMEAISADQVVEAVGAMWERTAR